MSFQRNFFVLLLISLAISGLGFSKRISIPLKTNMYGEVIFTAQYGTWRKCQVEFTPSINYCTTNIISKRDYDIESCGAQKEGKSNIIQGTIYSSPFSISDVQVPLSFIIPPPMDDLGNIFCFGSYPFAKEENALAQLFKEGKISEKRVFFSFNTTYDESEYIGEMHIGAPNNALIKKNAQLIELAASYGVNAYTALSVARIQFLGFLNFSSFKVLFQLTSCYIQVPQKVFDDIIQMFKEQGIQNNYNPYFKNDIVLLPSIEKLQPIKLTLLTKDNSQFNLIIKPSQYTHPYYRSTQHIFLIKANPKLTDQINLSYIVFKSYYVGFNLEGQSISIAEKEEEQGNNFRSSTTLN